MICNGLVLCVALANKFIRSREKSIRSTNPSTPADHATPTHRCFLQRAFAVSVIQNVEESGTYVAWRHET